MRCEKCEKYFAEYPHVSFNQIAAYVFSLGDDPRLHLDECETAISKTGDFLDTLFLKHCYTLLRACERDGLGNVENCRTQLEDWMHMTKMMLKGRLEMRAVGSDEHCDHMRAEVC